jgi:hypothetical protein
MAKLEGIIYKAFGNYLVLRGFAPISDLAKISRTSKSYQRDTNDQHKIDIINYLQDIKSYFPEVTLACRTNDYGGLVASIGKNNMVSNSQNKFVKGLYVLNEYLPKEGHRARHAYLELSRPSYEDKLLRVDGNHRLEPFSDPIEWWYQFIDNVPDDVKNESNKVLREKWFSHQAFLKKGEIGKMIIPFTIIISDAENAEKFEAKIFHDINFKQLPIRQETSLKIISELKAFNDYDKLGPEYPLALELIKKMDAGSFNDIPWLTNVENESKSYYRTTCLRLSQLLMSRKQNVKALLGKAINEIIDYADKFKEIEKEIENTKQKITDLEQDISNIELSQHHFEDTIGYTSKCIELEHTHKLLVNQELDLDNIKQQKEHRGYKIKKYKTYIDSCLQPSLIIDAISSLRTYYKDFGKKEYGNISMFVTMVYYSLLNENQLKSFVNWVKRNGINKIIAADDLSTDASSNLITMFEQIYKSKGNQIFISMKFNDSQSELIYEKIERAIDQFNAKNKSIHLNPHPIRIDRTIEASTYSIQDKILYAIQSCSLIIADLSSANINVYHEIGYAMGVAKSQDQKPNMILLYKEDSDYIKPDIDIDKFVGFNLRNLSQLRFKDYKQLVDGLVERLEKHYGV